MNAAFKPPKVKGPKQVTPARMAKVLTAKLADPDFTVRWVTEDYPRYAVYYKGREHVGFRYVEFFPVGYDLTLVAWTATVGSTPDQDTRQAEPKGSYMLTDLDLLAMALHVKQLYAEWVKLAPVPA